MSISTTDLLMAVAIFVITLLSGIMPFILKSKNSNKSDFFIGQSLANGVFLGAGLVHMLSDASNGFTKIGADYPWAYAICGATFLIFVLSENMGSALKTHNQSAFIAIMSTIMLSIHSFFTGSALGITTNTGLSLILFFAIMAHKWAASFSLSIYINKTDLKLVSRIALYLIFSIMVPLGMYFGNFFNEHHLSNKYLQPILMAIASGTFIYLGTLHGFKKSHFQNTEMRLSQYLAVAMGFMLMVVVAIWL